MLDIKVFGTTRVTTETGVVIGSELGGAKPRQILAILALADGPVAKDRLADLLWAGEPPRSYLGTLESYVCLLRRSLGQTRGRKSAIRTVMHGYLLDPDAVRVDLRQFRDLVRAGRAARTPAAALSRIEEALTLAGGELLASESYAGWAVQERETVQVELVTAASFGAAQALALDDHDTAVRLARLATARDSLTEGAWRTLMRALSASGCRGEALRAYGELRGHLMDELGADPSAETSDLYLELLKQDEGGPTGMAAGAHDEVSTLIDLLRQAVTGLPGHHQLRVSHALEQVVAGLAIAS